MGYGDFSAITRNKDARKKALNYIKPNEIEEIIKYSLNSFDSLMGDELYEEYANYIESLCN